jgi:long-subunit acyl-CoA synthetase (AMP-forming)
MTELCAIGLSNSASRPPKPGAVGNLLAGSQGKIVDVASGRLLGPHKRGELCLRGPQVMKGYWRKPQATADTIDKDGFLHTGEREGRGCEGREGERRGSDDH